MKYISKQEENITVSISKNELAHILDVLNDMHNVATSEEWDVYLLLKGEEARALEDGLLNDLDQIISSAIGNDK